MAAHPHTTTAALSGIRIEFTSRQKRWSMSGRHFARRLYTSLEELQTNCKSILVHERITNGPHSTLQVQCLFLHIHALTRQDFVNTPLWQNERVPSFPAGSNGQDVDERSLHIDDDTAHIARTHHHIAYLRFDLFLTHIHCVQFIPPVLDLQMHPR